MTVSSRQPSNGGRHVDDRVLLVFFSVALLGYLLVPLVLLVEDVRLCAVPDRELDGKSKLISSLLQRFQCPSN